MNELHKPVRRRFDKRTVFAKQVDDIWTADLIDMSSFSRSNKSYKYLVTVIDVFSKYGCQKLVKWLHRRFGYFSSVILLVVCGWLRALHYLTNS